MKKMVVCLCVSALVLASCAGNKEKKAAAEEVPKAAVVLTDGADWENVYSKIEPTAIEDNPVQLIGKQWMLITSGDSSSYNTMTASWGAIGEIWNKPVAITTVRNIRYTNQFLEKNDVYTLSFFDEDYRGALQLLGTKSGRDTDKVKESGLTPVPTPAGSMSFGEARMVVECRKLFAQPMLRENMIPEIAQTYDSGDGGHHILYVGEIVGVWVK